ncbi:MAG: hypothetical protein M1820_008979 [Bogoriella megaspora]|nr:MAG: hypothetical protein M1820_008979 [Bogoriella megaspora]
MDRILSYQEQYYDVGFLKPRGRLGAIELIHDIHKNTRIRQKQGLMQRRHSIPSFDHPPRNPVQTNTRSEINDFADYIEYFRWEWGSKTQQVSSNDLVTSAQHLGLRPILHQFPDNERLRRLQNFFTRYYTIVCPPVPARSLKRSLRAILIANILNGCNAHKMTYGYFASRVVEIIDGFRGLPSAEQSWKNTPKHREKHLTLRGVLKTSSANHQPSSDRKKLRFGSVQFTQIPLNPYGPGRRVRDAKEDLASGFSDEIEDAHWGYEEENKTIASKPCPPSLTKDSAVQESAPLDQLARNIQNDADPALEPLSPCEETLDPNVMEDFREFNLVHNTLQPNHRKRAFDDELLCPDASSSGAAAPDLPRKRLRSDTTRPISPKTMVTIQSIVLARRWPRLAEALQVKEHWPPKFTVQIPSTFMLPLSSAFNAKTLKMVQGNRMQYGEAYAYSAWCDGQIWLPKRGRRPGKRPWKIVHSHRGVRERGSKCLQEFTELHAKKNYVQLMPPLSSRTSAVQTPYDDRLVKKRNALLYDGGVSRANHVIPTELPSQTFSNGQNRMKKKAKSKYTFDVANRALRKTPWKHPSLWMRPLPEQEALASVSENYASEAISDLVFSYEEMRAPIDSKQHAPYLNTSSLRGGASSPNLSPKVYNSTPEISPTESPIAVSRLGRRRYTADNPRRSRVLQSSDPEPMYPTIGALSRNTIRDSGLNQYQFHRDLRSHPVHAHGMVEFEHRRASRDRDIANIPHTYHGRQGPQIQPHGDGVAPQDHLNLEDRRCALCFIDLQPWSAMLLLPCRHVIHAMCMRRWLGEQQQNTCPLCRSIVMPWRRAPRPTLSSDSGALEELDDHTLALGQYVIQVILCLLLVSLVSWIAMLQNALPQENLVEPDAEAVYASYHESVQQRLSQGHSTLLSDVKDNDELYALSEAEEQMRPEERSAIIGDTRSEDSGYEAGIESEGEDNSGSD